MWEIINGFHDNPETYLWAVLVAFAIYAVVFVIPNSFDKQAQRQKIRIGEIADENASICEKLDIKRGADKHSQCLLDIGQFQLQVEKRIYDEFAY